MEDIAVAVIDLGVWLATGGKESIGEGPGPYFCPAVIELGRADGCNLPGGFGGLHGVLVIFGWFYVECEVVGVNYRSAMVVSQTDAKFIRPEALKLQNSFQLILSINCVLNNA